MRSEWGMLAGTSLVLLALGLVLPDWGTFLLSMALARGLAVLGVMILLRAGLVSFGHGLFFASGAYAVGFAMQWWQVKDALALVLLGGMAGFLAALLTGLLIARYREIFFAMLTLAFSMVLYGLLVKAYDITGGSDGMRILLPSLLGISPPPGQMRISLYVFTSIWVIGILFVALHYLHSPLAYTMQAIRDNEVRTRYLGLSPYRAILLTYLLSGTISGIGGALVALNLGHITPQMAYWTTSGEFVFVAVLGGSGGVLAPIATTVLFDVIRTYAFKIAPYTWQMALGMIMLVIILFAPGGLSSLYEKAVGMVRQ